MTAPAVDCRGLVHVYRVAGTDIAALRGVDLTIPAGQRVAVLGPSGSGKSTLLQILAGILRPSAGTAALLGTDLGSASRRSVDRMRASSVGVMLQGAATNLLLHEDVAGNLAVLLGPHRRSDAAERVLRAGGLEGERRACGALSPSEQQTVALALAMAREPQVLLVDEPTSRLDPRARDRLLDQLVAVTTEHRTAVVLVTHDEQVAQRMDRMIHLRDGRIGEEVTSTGRYAVLAADGSVAIPSGLLGAGWTPGALIAVEADGASLRLTPVRREEP